jgi:hypothetical protein
MLREVNPVTAGGSRRSFRKPETAKRAACLLCRVLWPIVVQHRHLQFDDALESKTLFLTQGRPR